MYSLLERSKTCFSQNQSLHTDFSFLQVKYFHLIDITVIVISHDSCVLMEESLLLDVLEIPFQMQVNVRKSDKNLSN